MPYGGMHNGMLRENRTRSSLSAENEQADAGRDGQTHHARQFFSLTTSRIGNLTRLIYTLLLYIITIHITLVFNTHG